jgi:hypothetical protein
MSQANVRSVEAIKEFKNSLVTFAEDARVALGAMEMEIRQLRNWLERDQYSYWQGQVKRSKEAIAEALSDLHRRQLSQANSDAVSDSDQKEAVRMAKRRLAEAEDKVGRIKRWVPVLEHALSEYHSQSQPLGDKLSGGLIGTLAMLERMIVALEEYQAIQAPAAPVLRPATAVESAPPPTAEAVPAREPASSVETAEGSPESGSTDVEEEDRPDRTPSMESTSAPEP